MRAIIKGKEIKCPICGNNDFYKKEITIQAIERKNEYFNNEELYYIYKDELECNECGWTGYFTNNLDLDKNYNENKITYEE